MSLRVRESAKIGMGADRLAEGRRCGAMKPKASCNMDSGSRYSTWVRPVAVIGTASRTQDI